MPVRRVLRAAALVGTAIAGVLVAHELDYRLVVPDPAHRHDLLFRTGHGYLGRAALVGLVVGLVAGFAQLALGFARARGAADGPRGARETALRLALVQSGGFVTLEAVERLVVGAPPDDRLPLVTVVGIAVQVVLALAGALVLALLARTGAAAARALARPVSPAEPVAVARASDGIASRRGPLAGAAGNRGPPLVPS